MHTTHIHQARNSEKKKEKMKLKVPMRRLGRTNDHVGCQKLMKLLYFVQNSISIDQAIHHLLPEKQHQQLPLPCQSEHMPAKIKDGTLNKGD